jgi:adenosyl cobinamide kinase/adenosyl cobinamide phosphate guanylyltransferase
MLHIDDARAGQHQWAFDSAALRFWRPHQGESLYVSSAGMWPDGFHVRVRNHRNQRHSLLVVQIGSDPEQAILMALEKWWADRS